MLKASVQHNKPRLFPMKHNIPEFLPSDTVAYDRDAARYLSGRNPTPANHYFSRQYTSANQNSPTSESNFRSISPGQIWYGFCDFDWSDSDRQEGKMIMNPSAMTADDGFLPGMPYDTEAEQTGECVLFRMHCSTVVAHNLADNMIMAPVIVADRLSQTTSENSKHQFDFKHHLTGGLYRPKFTILPMTQLSQGLINTTQVQHNAQSNGRIYLHLDGRYFFGWLFLAQDAAVDLGLTAIGIATERLNRPWNIRPSTGKGQ